MYIKRQIESSIHRHLQNRSEIFVLYGARQVGKSTLLNKVLDETTLKILRINGEEFKYQRIFSARSLDEMAQVVEGYDGIFIDEAQTIENIGVSIKILHDAQPDLKILLSGSSSFELANRVKEPLTGRTRTILLYPLAFRELKSIFNSFELQEYVATYLVFGGYPGLFQVDERKQKIKALTEMSSSYLFKDVLAFANLKNPRLLVDLLTMLAFQIGSPVSIHELAKSLKTSSETISRYIDLLEKSFVVFRLSSYSNNLRKEIKKMDKIYFYDLGIRNAIIGNFARINDRNDIGQLWENFLVVERLKQIEYNDLVRQSFFWRTYNGVELDYVETFDGQVHGYEFKWSTKKNKAPITWTKKYPSASYQVVNRHSFLDFVLGVDMT
ncbi:MAG TPA: ATP-binding protein [Saprospiraceae bacterium]|nr:ATP-binding protein [Saprospiraceae bacterium]